VAKNSPECVPNRRRGAFLRGRSRLKAMTRRR
jgi:hypothetical protein